MTESFVFYESFYNAIELLQPEEQLEAYKAITAYALKGEETELTSVGAKIVFGMAKPNLDAAKNKRENGKKGGRPQKKTNESKTQKPANEKEKPQVIENKNHRLLKNESNVDVNVNVNGNVDVNVNENANANVDVNDDDDDNVDDCASACGGRDDEAGNQSVELVEWLDRITTPEDKEQFEMITQYLFDRYRKKRILQLDYSKVMEKAHRLGVTPDGEHYAAFSTERADLLEYAFEQAAAADQVNWKYIDGIYNNFEKRGIQTRDDAYRHEFERQQGMSTDEFMDKFYGSSGDNA